MTGAVHRTSNESIQFYANGLPPPDGGGGGGPALPGAAAADWPPAPALPRESDIAASAAIPAGRTRDPVGIGISLNMSAFVPGAATPAAIANEVGPDEAGGGRVGGGAGLGPEWNEGNPGCGIGIGCGCAPPIIIIIPPLPGRGPGPAPGPALVLGPPIIGGGA